MPAIVASEQGLAVGASLRHAYTPGELFSDLVPASRTLLLATLVLALCACAACVHAVRMRIENERIARPKAGVQFKLTPYEERRPKISRIAAASLAVACLGCLIAWRVAMAPAYDGVPFIPALSAPPPPPP